MAVAWQRLVSSELNPIPLRYTGALFCAVWTIYLADRYLDARRPQQADEPPRHRFSRQWRPLLLGLIAANLVALPLFAPLPFEAALPIVTALGVYFLIVHAFRLSWPKELAVATLFALGVAVPFHPFPFVLDFAFLCFWNCTAIEYWERGMRQLHALPAWLAVRLTPAALTAAAICLASTRIFNPTIQGTLAVTFVLCAVLSANAARMNPLGLRVLADLILLTPLLAL